MQRDGKPLTFDEVLQAAIADLAANGYTGPDQIAKWMRLLRQTAEETLGQNGEVDKKVRDAMRQIYRRMVENAGVAKSVPGVGQYTLAMVAPDLRAELDRRILAAADLIKLNRTAAIEKTLQRFAGWSTSIPDGGSDVIDKREVRMQIAKPVKQVKFEARRVAIDQGHKLNANLAEIVAVSQGAIGAVWHSHWRQPGYDYRPDHKERDGNFYVQRDSWAMAEGYIKAGGPYVDQITRPGEEVYCQCNYVWITRLTSVPVEFLTRKGRAKVAEIKGAKVGV